jgi:hypothetical protein
MTFGDACGVMETQSGGILAPAGPIGSTVYDSIVDKLDGGVVTYVIRRPCQTLPCFVVHYD